MRIPSPATYLSYYRAGTLLAKHLGAWFNAFVYMSQELSLFDFICLFMHVSPASSVICNPVHTSVALNVLINTGLIITTYSNLKGILLA